MMITELEHRILSISYKYKLSHIGSCLTAVSIIDGIYKRKKDNDIFILSSGHAGLALYVVLEKYYKIDAEGLYIKHGVHPNKDINNHIICSSGSLGLGLPIAIGYAVVDKNRNVYCLISDGECAEGSIWESLAFIRSQKLKNINVFVNINGYSAYKKLDIKYLSRRLVSFLPSIKLIKTNLRKFKFLHGLDAHYYTLKKEDHDEIQNL